MPRSKPRVPREVMRCGNCAWSVAFWDGTLVCLMFSHDKGAWKVNPNQDVGPGSITSEGCVVFVYNQLPQHKLELEISRAEKVRRQMDGVPEPESVPSDLTEDEIAEGLAGLGEDEDINF